jgi:Polyketide cyclase / dehydrase and lipid transport
MTAVKKMDDGPLVVGSKVRVRQPKLLPAVWLVTQLDKNRVFTWGTRHPGIQITGDHRIESVGSSSRVTLSLDVSGPLAPLVSRLFRGLNKRYIATEAKGLKERCEAG